MAMKEFHDFYFRVLKEMSNKMQSEFSKNAFFIELLFINKLVTTDNNKCLQNNILGFQ